MRLGVNIPNFGTDRGLLRDWAHTVEGLGYETAMVSDHVVITPDVAEEYPEPFYEPFTLLSWLAGVTSRVRLGTTVLVLPYRHPLLVARMAANLNDLSDGRFILGVGTGWAREEFAALGVPSDRRGALTDEGLAVIRKAWQGAAQAAAIPIWVGGNGPAARRRARELGDAWHPLRCTLDWLRAAIADDAPRGFAPRIALQIRAEPVRSSGRLAGVGTIEQVVDDLRQLRDLGADDVILDPYQGDPAETARPREAWGALDAVATQWRNEL